MPNSRAPRSRHFTCQRATPGHINEERLIWHNLEIKQTYMEFSALKTYIKDQNLMVMAGFHSLSYRTYLVLKLNISNKSGIRSLIQLY